MSNSVALDGSARPPLPGVPVLADTEELKSNRVTVTVVLKKDAPADTAAKLAEWAQAQGLFPHPLHNHRVKINGPVSALEKAFETQVKYVLLETRRRVHRVREGTICVPEELRPSILAVLGLDNRPLARPHFARCGEDKRPLHAFTAKDLVSIYNLPTTEGHNGSGQTIAILELGGGFHQADLDSYSKSLGISPLIPRVVGIDGAHNAPGDDADGEVLLDIEVAGGIAPAAKLVVYFTPNTDQGFVDAIHHVAEDRPTVLSISWGAPEDQWTGQARAAMNQALELCAANGITVTVAAGDNGYTDGEGWPVVDFPAASPFVLGCGGTTLTATATTFESELVWGTTDDQGQVAEEGGTGGGFSQVFAFPAYQARQTLLGAAGATDTGQLVYRGVPDVAGVADPATGYKIFLDGRWQVIGGTSAVAPLWAGITALLANAMGKRFGLLNPALYLMAARHGFHVVKAGNNGLYKARDGWSACCGLGSPNGRGLLTGLHTLGF